MRDNLDVVIFRLSSNKPNKQKHTTAKNMHDAIKRFNSWKKDRKAIIFNKKTKRILFIEEDNQIEFMPEEFNRFKLAFSSYCEVNIKE